MAATALDDCAMSSKPGGSSSASSPCDIQTCERAVESFEQGESSRSSSTSACPYSRLSPGLTLPPSLWVMKCRP